MVAKNPQNPRRIFEYPETKSAYFGKKFSFPKYQIIAVRWTPNPFSCKCVYKTRSSGSYTALLLAPAEGWWPSATSRWFFVFRMGIFRGSVFWHFVILSFFRFLDFKGSFLNFENSESFFGISGHIWGGSVFWHFVIWSFFQFLDFKGSFLSLIFEFWKFRKFFWNQWAYLGRVCFVL